MSKPSQLLYNQPLKDFTYMKVGGLADELIIAKDQTELIEAIRYGQSSTSRYMILGGGSNTIFSDAGYRGLIIINKTNQLKIDPAAGTVSCDSGVITNLLVNQTVNAGLSGLEVFLGIPGTVGGAIYNNSHYLKELIGNQLQSAQLLDNHGNLKNVTRDYFNFAYDYSILHLTKETILSAVFQLHSHDKSDLKQISQAALNRRQTTQPLSLPSSGCMFQNIQNQDHLVTKILDPGVTSAGALIDKAGLKNTRVGGARISEVHANFIVNDNQATAQDIIDLSNLVINTIKEKYQIQLLREVFILNEYGERLNI